MRVTIYFDTLNPGLLVAVQGWHRRWQSQVTVIAQQYGCGCNHDLYELDAPEEALADLPEGVSLSRAAAPPGNN